MSRKHCWKRINCSLRAISPFPAVFSEDLFCRHIKTRAWFGKGLTLYQIAEFQTQLYWRNLQPFKKITDEQVEDTVGKEEDTGYHIYSFFQNVFKRLLSVVKSWCCFLDSLTIYTVIETLFSTVEKRDFGNFLGKEENAVTCIFQLCCLPYWLLVLSSHASLWLITRRQNFRLVQIKTKCRRHFKVHLK